MYQAVSVHVRSSIHSSVSGGSSSSTSSSSSCVVCQVVSGRVRSSLQLSEDQSCSPMAPLLPSMPPCTPPSVEVHAGPILRNPSESKTSLDGGSRSIGMENVSPADCPAQNTQYWQRLPSRIEHSTLAKIAQHWQHCFFWN